MGIIYIFVVNPIILSQSGLPTGAVALSTIVIAAFATILMGVYTKLPFAVAPGLEMSGYFTFVICGVLGFHWSDGLSAVFLSGLLCLLASIGPISARLVEALPAGLKRNITISVGVFVATTGFHLAGFFHMSTGQVDFGSFSFSAIVSTNAVLLYIGFGLSLVLSHPSLRIPGGILIAIILTSILSIALGVEANDGIIVERSLRQDIMEASHLIADIDLLAALKSPLLFTSAIVLAFIQIFGGIGKYVSLTDVSGMRLKSGDPKISRAMRVDGLGTTVGAVVGTSSLITFVESSMGISSGGRTGVTSIVCGLLIFACILLRDLINLVPIQALSGILVFVLYLILRTPLSESDTFKAPGFNFVVRIVMAVLAYTTFSLEIPMCVGCLAYSVRGWFFHKKMNYILLGSAIVMATIIAIQRI